MNDFRLDVRHAFRMFGRNPGFTFIVVLTLALGIGANTAVFSVVNAALLKPLPYPSNDRLALVWDVNPKIRMGFDRLPVSAGTFSDWRAGNRSMEAMSVVSAYPRVLTGNGEPERIGGANVSAGFFALMGVAPATGREFRSDEDAPGAPKTVVIADSLRRRKFGDGPNPVGKTLIIDGEPYEIIGTAPPEFTFPRPGEMPSFADTPLQTEAWMPAAFTEEQLAARGNHELTVIGKLKPGVSIAQAQADFSDISRRLEHDHPQTNEGYGALVVSLRDQIVGDFRPALTLFSVAVAFVLAIACINVANLLLVKASARRRETALRSALGAGRGRLVRQLLTESLVLACIGGAVGILPAVWSVNALSALSPWKALKLHQVGVDSTVLGFTALVSVVTGVLFGVLPALPASKANLSETLKNRDSGLGGVKRRDARKLLIAVETAVSLVLLIGAGLAVKGFWRLLAQSPGFNPTRVVTLTLSLPATRYAEAPRQRDFFQQVVERLKAVPGVESAGAVSDLPLSGAENMGGFSIENAPVDPSGRTPLVNRRSVTPDYFQTLSIPIKRGRGFAATDGPTAPGVAVVSESWVRHYMPNEDPIGKRVKAGSPQSDRPWLEIVGVAGDVRHTSLTSDLKPHLYFPFAQRPTPTMTLTARTKIEPESLIASMRAELRALDKDLPLSEVKTMTAYIDESAAQPRFQMLLMAIFAVSALGLAAVGMYGVVSAVVVERTKEIGIRTALGAAKSDILKLIVGQGMTAALLGVAVGLPGAFGLTRLMETMIFGVSPTDGGVFAGISGLLLATALVACLIPARRATKVEPMTALRNE